MKYSHFLHYIYRPLFLTIFRVKNLDSDGDILKNEFCELEGESRSDCRIKIRVLRIAEGFVKLLLTTRTTQNVTTHCFPFRRTWFRYPARRSFYSRFTSVLVEKESGNIPEVNHGHQDQGKPNVRLVANFVQFWTQKRNNSLISNRPTSSIINNCVCKTTSFNLHVYIQRSINYCHQMTAVSNNRPATLHKPEINHLNQIFALLN